MARTYYDVAPRHKKVISRYMRAADNLINAANHCAKFDAGSKGLRRATDSYTKHDAEYKLAHAELVRLLEVPLHKGTHRRKAQDCTGSPGIDRIMQRELDRNDGVVVKRKGRK